MHLRMNCRQVQVDVNTNRASTLGRFKGRPAATARPSGSLSLERERARVRVTLDILKSRVGDKPDRPTPA
jgi:hypothetical protein